MLDIGKHEKVILLSLIGSKIRIWVLDNERTNLGKALKFLGASHDCSRGVPIFLPHLIPELCNDCTE